MAEFQKFKRDGLVEEEVRNCLQSIGFDRVDAQYVWYMGQGVITHTFSEDTSNLIEKYLRSTLPASRTLFKYIRFIAIK